MKHLKTLLVVALFGLAMSAVTGCNTVEGVGEDVSSAGSGLADLADDAKPRKKE